jgi:two-component system, OmpR family, sensor histidine kinase BaeS
MRKRGLTRRLAVAFALVAVATAAMAGLTLSYVWQRQFETYVRQGLRDNAEGYALAAARIYSANGGWPSTMQLSMTQGMTQGLRVQIFDSAGHKLIDSADTVHAMMGGAPPTDPPSGAIGEVVPVVVATATVGQVKVWSVTSNGLLSARDVAFQSSSTTALLVAGAVAIILASAAGVIFARGIVKPINQVTATAAALRSGDAGARTGMQGEDPVRVLGKTLDEMADAMQADRDFERRLTADVAHELRTPLMAIQATVEAMQDGVLPADEERLQIVRDETVRLARLADSILELARLERGAVPFADDVIDPAKPLTAAMATHKALVECAGLTLNESLEEGLKVRGDMDRLTQAFGNLLSNAARYTPEGGSVTVTLRRSGDNAVVSIVDTGIGIGEENLGRVFVRFWRADEARSRATGGLGVGLAVVKEIIDRHHGTITVSSRPGEGTEFAVRLPLATSRPANGARKG